MIVRYNLLIYFTLFLSFLLSAFVAFNVSWGKYTFMDLELRMLENIGMKFQDFQIILASILALLFLLKIISKWMAATDLRQNSTNYHMIVSVPKAGKRRIWTYNMIEIFYYTLMAVGSYYFSEDAWAVAIVSAVMVIEILAYTAFIKNDFRLGLSGNGLILLTRTGTIIPFVKLKKIEKDFDCYFFTYGNGKVKKIPFTYMETEDRNKLIRNLKATLSQKKIFFADNL